MAKLDLFINVPTINLSGLYTFDSAHDDIVSWEFCTCSRLTLYMVHETEQKQMLGAEIVCTQTHPEPSSFLWIHGFGSDYTFLTVLSLVMQIYGNV